MYKGDHLYSICKFEFGPIFKMLPEAVAVA